MNLDNLPIDLPPVPPSTTDQLAALCRAQTKMIESLRADLQRANTANQTLGGELLQASHERSEALVVLRHSVHQGKELCHRLVHERDTVLTALRSVMGHLANQPITSLTYFGGEAFGHAAAEAAELLRVIDQLQRHQRKVDAESN